MEIKPSEDRPLFYIRHWADHFENSGTEKIKEPNPLRWVACPTKHDGKGFRRVSRLINAVPVFCAWSLLYQVAAKCPIRGVLADEDGPLTPLDLSDGTGYPEEIFTEAFKALASDKIGWIGVIKSGSIRIHPDSSERSRLHTNKQTSKTSKTTPTDKEDGGLVDGGEDLGDVERQLRACGISQQCSKDLAMQQGLSPALIRFGYRAAEAHPPPVAPQKKNPQGLLKKWIEDGSMAHAATSLFESRSPKERAKFLIPFIRAGDIASIAGHVISPDEKVGQGTMGLVLGSGTIPPEKLIIEQIKVVETPPQPIDSKAISEGKSHAA